MAISLGDKPAIQCKRCMAFKPPFLYWKRMPTGLFHLGAACESCAVHIQWLTQDGVWLAHAPTKPSASENTPDNQSGLFGGI